MAFTPVPNTVEVRLVARYLGQSVTNALYYTFSRVPSQADIQQLGQDAAGLWSTHVVPVLSNNYRLVEVYCRDLSAQASYIYAYTGRPLPSTGGVAGQPMPSSVAVVVTLRTGLAGRSYRGRLYISGLTEPQVDGDFPNPNVRQQIITAVGTVGFTLNTTNRTWVVVSRYHALQRRQIGVSTPVIAVAGPTLRIAQQRKRLP